MAGYGTACGIAGILDRQDTYRLLSETMEEESEADAGLEELLEAILTGDTMDVDESAQQLEEEEEELDDEEDFEEQREEEEI